MWKLWVLGFGGLMVASAASAAERWPENVCSELEQRNQRAQDFYKEPEKLAIARGTSLVLLRMHCDRDVTAEAKQDIDALVDQQARQERIKADRANGRWPKSVCENVATIEGVIEASITIPTDRATSRQFILRMLRTNCGVDTSAKEAEDQAAWNASLQAGTEALNEDLRRDPKGTKAMLKNLKPLNRPALVPPAKQSGEVK